MKLHKLKIILPWALYNFASTIYAINIISLYFALWVTVVMRGPDIYYSLAFSSSVFIAAMLAPLIGYFADRLGKIVPFLMTFTLLCILGTAALGITHNLILALIIFTLTNLCYQCSDIVYNMLIPKISAGENVGEIAGIGTGLGYFGTIAGVALVGPIVAQHGIQAAFIPTAALFLLFALPALLMIREKKLAPPEAKYCAPARLREVILKPLHTLTHLRSYPDLAITLLAIFIAFNTIDTVFIFMSVYLKKVVGFLDNEFTLYYVICAIFAILSGVIGGFVVDKIGAKKVLISSLLIWSFALFLAIILPYKPMFWLVGPIVGVGLGLTWTSSRTLIVKLAPPEQSGEFFGFYGMAIKLAAIIGPLVWGLCVWIFGFLGMAKYRITLIVLLLLLLSGILILRHVTSKENEKLCFTREAR